MKTKSEISTILLDLNCYAFQVFHYYQENHKKNKMQNMNQNYNHTNTANFNIEDRISFEEIIDTILQCMNITISYCPTNRVALYVFDEEKVERLFPVADEDEHDMRMLSFRKIKMKIHNSIMNF